MAMTKTFTNINDFIEDTKQYNDFRITPSNSKDTTHCIGFSKHRYGNTLIMHRALTYDDFTHHHFRSAIKEENTYTVTLVDESILTIKASTASFNAEPCIIDVFSYDKLLNKKYVDCTRSHHDPETDTHLIVIDYHKLGVLSKEQNRSAKELVRDICWGKAYDSSTFCFEFGDNFNELGEFKVGLYSYDNESVYRLSTCLVYDLECGDTLFLEKCKEVMK